MPSYSTLRPSPQGLKKTEGSPSNLGYGCLAYFRDRYDISAFIGMTFPRKDEAINNPLEGHIAFYEKMFESGVRFPFILLRKSF